MSYLPWSNSTTLRRVASVDGVSHNGPPAIARPAERLFGHTEAVLLPALGVGLAWLALALVSLAISVRAPTSVLGPHLLLTLAPAAAGAACFWSWRGAAPSLRPTWFLFGLAGLGVAARELAAMLRLATGAVPSSASSGLSYTLLIGAHLAIAVGAALAIPALRSRRLAGGLLLDAALVAIAGGLFALQLAVEHGRGVPIGQLLLVLGTQLATAGSLFAIGLLLVWRDPALPRLPTLGLVTTATAFGVGNTAVTLGLAGSPGMYLDVIWITGWLGLAFAGVTARALREGLPEPAPGRLAGVIGGVLIPAGSLYVAAMGLSSVLAPYLGGEIGLALWFLTAPLAVRVGQGVRTEVRRKAQGRELVQTRALVELNRALATALELEPTLQLVAGWARKLTDARAAAIQLLSDDGSALELRAVTGLSSDALGLVLPVMDSLTGAVVRDGKPRVVHDCARLGSAHPQEIQLFGSDAAAAAPLIFRGRALGVLVVAGCGHPFDHDEMAMLASMADSAAVAIENARLFEEVRGLSLTDPLTGLSNRRALELVLVREFAAARRGRRLVVVMLDVDGFKRFNDTRGHLAGDEALRTLGSVLLNETRAMNQAARYGGDEFVVVLTETDLRGAEIFAERMRWRFRDAMAASGGGLDLTCGLAGFDPEMTAPADLIAAADRALYRAKARSGSPGPR